MTKITVKYEAEIITEIIGVGSGCDASHVRLTACLAKTKITEIVAAVVTYGQAHHDGTAAEVDEAFAVVSDLIRDAKAVVTAEADTDLDSLTKAKRKWAPKEAK